jgi:predicted Zn finger-like uncharacterized protein
MIVTCNECESSFNVDDGLIKDGGSKVRCSKCSSVFVVHPGTSDSELGVDADDFALEVDEDLEADLESDEEFGDLATDDADDELPDLDEMMDFDDDEPAVAAAGEDVSGELEPDMDVDVDEGQGSLSEEFGSLDEDELDLDLEDESMAEADETEPGHVEASDDGLLDLDMDLDDLDQVEEADLDMEETDLDLETEEMEPAATEAASVQDEGDALDLSDLEDLVGFDADSDLEAVAVDASGDDGLDMDLDDLDQVEEADLDMEETDLGLDAEEMEPAVTEAASVQDESDALDLSDLEDLVGSDEDSNLEDMAVEASDDTELDLSDLDDVLETEEEPVEEDLSVEASEELDLDSEPVAEEPFLDSSAELDDADELDLSELDGIMETEETAAEAVSEDNLDEELELDFEVDGGAAETAAVESAEDFDKLEMTDLEKMLEPDETPTSGDTEELNLDLDLDLESESAAETSASAEGDAGPDDAEFLDIETMLEESEDSASAGPGAEEPVELDLDAVMTEAAESKEPELELNLDLGDDMTDTESAQDISEPGEEDLEFKLLDSDEETLQFGATQAHATQIDDGLTAGSDPGATTDDFATDDFSESRDLEDQTDITDQIGTGFPPPVKPRRSRKPVLAVFFLLLLSLIGYVVIQNLGIHIPYVSDIKIPYLSDAKIPYLSGLLKSGDQDVAGNLKIIPMGKTISHKFIENTAAGNIFVIKGRVRNDYNHPRSHIKITGKLYRRDKALAKTATVYCGNVLTESDLAKMNITVINKRLQNRFGDKRSNIKVKAGKTIPFLIVFNKLPANLDEYTVEVSGSSS